MTPGRSGSVAAAVLLVLSYLAGPLTAQDGTRPLELRRLDAPIHLDGQVSEPAWEAIRPFELVMFEPTAGATPTERTEIRVAYDEEYLYASGRFFTASRGDIRASSLYRDRLGADDVFGILLDTYDDNENAVVFATNPAGVRVDESVGADGSQINRDFNTYWSVETSQDERGWSAEIRIPLSSLRFQPRGDSVAMGIIVSRFSAATNETSTFPALSPGFANATSRPALARSIVLRGVQPRSVTWVTPYVLTGEERLPREPGAGRRVTDRRIEVGVDAKLGLADNLNLDLTLNTDFAQVEVDDERVNLSRFSLFFPEKRQFFLERSGIFDLQTEVGRQDPGRFFHTRRIGLTTEGRPLRIYGGARLVGRIGDWDIGALDMQVEGVDEPENIGVLRLRRRIVNERSTAGVFLTSRLGQERSRNVAYALDARLNVFGQDYLDVQVAQSHDGGSDGLGAETGMLRVSLERRSTLTTRGFGYNVGWKRSGRGFHPGVGFTPRRDFTNYAVNLNYGFFPERSRLRSLQPSLFASVHTRNADGRLDTSRFGSFLNYGLRSGLVGWFGVTRNEEVLDDPLPLSPDVSVPPGRYTTWTANAGIRPPPGDEFRLTFSGQLGELYDGARLFASLGPEWDLSRHLQLVAEYGFERLAFDRLSKVLRTDVARLKVQASLDARLSGSSFVQYNRLHDRLIVNLRLRYHLGEGHDLWLVINDELEPPAAPARGGLESARRSVLVKYSRPLGFAGLG